MSQYLLKTLLQEYLRQLEAAANTVQKCFESQGLSSAQRRVWNAAVLFRISPPTEDTPEDQWHWEEYYPRAPALEALDETIEAFERFIDGLPTGSEEPSP